ncbi:hypothetical protein BKA62DRAFT_832734, partial [Auriculariales sp. MPI-PUGE-AT-0066]
MPFAEQFNSSSRTTVPFYLPPQQSTSNQAYAIHPYAYPSQPYATSSSPAIQVHPMNAPLPVAPSRRTSPTSPASSLSLPSPGARAPHSVPLHRGEACLHCRKRKMQCDAFKPACSPCMSNGKECETKSSRTFARSNSYKTKQSCSGQALQSSKTALHHHRAPHLPSPYPHSRFNHICIFSLSLNRPRQQRRIFTTQIRHIRTRQEGAHYTRSNSETTFGEQILSPALASSRYPHALCNSRLHVQNLIHSIWYLTHPPPSRRFSGLYLDILCSSRAHPHHPSSFFLYPTNPVITSYSGPRCRSANPPDSIRNHASNNHLHAYTNTHHKPHSFVD